LPSSAPPDAPLAAQAPAEVTDGGATSGEQTAGGWWSSTRNRWLAGLGAALVVIVVAAVLLTSGGGGSHTVNGTFSLLDNDTASSDCHGQGGFGDIDQGTTVTVKNESGTILGSGALSAGKADSLGFTCTYKFAINGVGDAKFYAIEVSHRGSVSYSASKMDSLNWRPALSLS